MDRLVVVCLKDISGVYEEVVHPLLSEESIAIRKHICTKSVCYGEGVEESQPNAQVYLL